MKNLQKFKKDYEVVMAYWMGESKAISKVNEIVLSSKYYSKYEQFIKFDKHQALYIESFLDYFRNTYDLILLNNDLVNNLPSKSDNKPSFKL